MAVQDMHATELPAVTASADFAVTLADVDSSPASLLETMASGVPLVVGRAPSMEEWIQQGEGGEIVDRHDVDGRGGRDGPRLARDPELRPATASATCARCTRASTTPTAQLEQVLPGRAGPARILALAFDGGDYDLIKRLMAEGKLPTISRLAREGTLRGAPLDDPRLHPDRLVDVPDGTEPGRPRDLRLPDQPEPRRAEARERRQPHGDADLRSLGSAGIRSAYVGIPFTYPAEPLDGIVVTGYGGPDKPQILPESTEEKIFAASPDLVTAHHPMRSAGGRTSPRTPGA